MFNGIFCEFRFSLPPSFLFRRKEAKENHLPDWFLRFSLHFAQSCCTKRTAHIRAGRFFVASWMCGKPPSVRNAPLSHYVFCFFSSRKEIVPLLFFLEEKNGQLAREAQALRRTDAGTSCVVVGRNTTAGMPPSSALSLPVSAAPACQLSRANRPRKRKSSAEQLPTCAPAAFANVLHKTDGSYVNRPFFRSKQDTQESIYSQINQLPRSVFCFFSSRKEIVPL